MGNVENAGNLHFLYFLMFSTIFTRNFVIWTIFNLSSASAFNLVQSKILSFGKGLKFLKYVHV